MKQIWQKFLALMNIVMSAIRNQAYKPPKVVIGQAKKPELPTHPTIDVNPVRPWMPEDSDWGILTELFEGGTGDMPPQTNAPFIWGPNVSEELAEAIKRALYQKSPPSMEKSDFVIWLDQNVPDPDIRSLAKRFLVADRFFDHLSKPATFKTILGGINQLIFNLENGKINIPQTAMLDVIIGIFDKHLEHGGIVSRQEARFVRRLVTILPYTFSVAALDQLLIIEAKYLAADVIHKELQSLPKDALDRIVQFPSDLPIFKV